MAVNPELVKLAREMLASAEKQGFVTADAMKQAQGMPPGGMPMDPSMQGMPMDPSMMGGAPPAGMPMPPAGPTPAMPPPPPGGMPPPPAASPAAASPPPDQGGMPSDGGGQPVVVNIEDLVALFQQIAGAGGGQGDNEPTTTNVSLGKRLDALEGKIDELGSLLASLTGAPPGGGGEVPPGAAGAAPEIPPELMAQLGAGAAPMPPDAMATGGIPMDPSMMGGAPMPPAGMAPPMPPGMAVSASDKRAATYSLAKLAAMLRGNTRA